MNQTIAGTGSLFRKEVWVHVRFKKEFIPCHFSLSMYVRSSMKVLSGCLPEVEKTKKTNNNNNNNRECNFLRHPGLPVGCHIIKK